MRQPSRRARLPSTSFEGPLECERFCECRLREVGLSSAHVQRTCRIPAVRARFTRVNVVAPFVHPFTRELRQRLVFLTTRAEHQPAQKVSPHRGKAVAAFTLGILNSAPFAQLVERNIESLASDEHSRRQPMGQAQSRAESERVSCAAKPLLAPAHKG